MIYEINYLILQSKTAELEAIREKTKKFIETFGASVVEEKEYLKRKLAYEIQHENYGFYTVLRFEFKSTKNLDELKQKLNQEAEVARYIIVRAEDLPSLDEQDAKELEKIHTNQKSIKSEDVEKVISEQKKAEKVKKEAKPKAEVKEEAVEQETEKEEKAEGGKVEKKEKAVEPKKEKKKAETKKKGEEIKEEDSSDNEVSLDELDKKLDEILNS